MSPRLKTIALWASIILIAALLAKLVDTKPSTETKWTYSQFREGLASGAIERVQIRDSRLEGLTRDGKRFYTYILDDPVLYRELEASDTIVEVMPEEEQSWLISALLTWLLPMAIFLVIWIFLLRQMQGGGSKALSFGKSRAKLTSDKAKRVTFANVAGVDEAKEELDEIIDFLTDPQKYQRLGGKLPKGVLLVGAPGTGKTLLARAIAGEAQVPFFSISGSDFVEMFVGVGASRVRDLFEQGKKHAPCIIFVDEIDAVGRYRGAGLGGGHDEREQTLNQLLVEMDGFESSDGVILIAATNRPDVLDPALMRPGRFDRQIVVNRPDQKGREAILKVHTKEIKLAEDVDLAVVSRGTPGFTGADLANLVNEAALLAARRGRENVAPVDMEDAKDKVLMGVERRSLIITDEEKRNTAYHEAGHALIAELLKHPDPVHKVTIIPRGRALGLTQQLPIDDKHNYDAEYLNDQLACLLGGRAAEELFLHTITTGAGNDLEVATNLSRKMVCEWGMSEKVGPLTFGKREEHIFLGREFAQPKDFSEATAVKIDEEIERLVMQNYARAKETLRSNESLVHALAEALLDKEVLDGSEIRNLVKQFKSPNLQAEQLEGETDSPVEDGIESED
ncbi:MAG: ATP-dependent zinc metalloprotease FtsH [Candidatus Coatesbacteria bacterium]|nr:ATP-dependent zinc metalloprotease FtsH [Candidatus Coatesbacteria bacterium]